MAMSRCKSYHPGIGMDLILMDNDKKMPTFFNYVGIFVLADRLKIEPHTVFVWGSMEVFNFCRW